MSTVKPKQNKKYNIYILRFLRDRFNLESDNADVLLTLEYIRKGVEFKGTNLWILIFAIFIASIGLNVNSTAVIIGAMLISPLMGPILGIGTSVAINDLELLKKSAKNLAIATVFSVATSSLYFAISPLSDAQSELLARTTPTIFDVLIAFFGGLAGIVASSRKEKGNAIPGVAIATALMPPLCTAGFGIATGNFYYFLGAFYLYFINGVFISVSTFLIVRFLKYPKKEFEDKALQIRVRRIIIAAVVITIIPSIYLAYRVVERGLFEHNASKFISQEFNFENSKVINRSYTYDTDPPKIEVSLYGETVEKNIIDNAREKLKNYKLSDAELVVFQGYEETSNAVSIESLRTGIIEDLYKKNSEIIKSKDDQLKVLEQRLVKLEQTSQISPRISMELKALYPTLTEFSLSNTLVIGVDSMKVDTMFVAVSKFSRKPSRTDMQKLSEWLKARLNSQKVEMILK